jgi:GTP-binding protein YchF
VPGNAEKIGIIGLPQTGKTTLFNALTRLERSTAPTGGGRRESSVASVPVPDARYDFAVGLFSPKKQTPAAIEFVDDAAPFGTGDQNKVTADFFEGLRRVDALALIVRCFDAPYPPAPDRGLTPGRDIQTVLEEMLLGDMALIETRLERIEKTLKTRKAGAPAPEQLEKEILLKLQAHLDEGRPLRTLDLTPDERRATRSFAFLTEKPVMVVANIGEESIGKEDADPLVQQAKATCQAEGLPLIALCARAEEEVAQLAPDEEKAFLEAYGITEPARNRLIQLAYDTLGLMSFFTVGEDEVRAWTVEKGATASQAAGKIHSDLERFFIRAEVLEFPN